MLCGSRFHHEMLAILRIQARKLGQFLCSKTLTTFLINLFSWGALLSPELTGKPLKAEKEKTQLILRIIRLSKGDR